MQVLFPPLGLSGASLVDFVRCVSGMKSLGEKNSFCQRTYARNNRRPQRGVLLKEQQDCRIAADVMNSYNVTGLRLYQFSL